MDGGRGDRGTSEGAARRPRASAPPAAYAAIGAPPVATPAVPEARSARPACRSPTTRSTRSCPDPSNRFAHAAAMAVAEAPPSTAYNPLFIYGGVGLGKTHLLIAVGHHMYRLTPALRVKYVTSEQFVTEFIKAVRERQGDAFRQRYREVDVLLVDDIQFLAKREETQTEFFHTFNHLHGAGQPDRDRVATARRTSCPASKTAWCSRFRWGLCVDVQPPDLETRIAILQLKAERDDHPRPARRHRVRRVQVRPDVRELEGALVRVVAWSRTHAASRSTSSSPSGRCRT